MSLSTNRKNLYKLVQIALVTAIVVVFQLLGSFIHFGTFSVSLVLVPIVFGAILYGPLVGAWLGLVFGVTVLLSGDASLFLGFSPLWTVVTVLLKGIFAGFAAGVIYKAIAKKHKYVAAVTAAIICPVVNTGVFILGCFTFFYNYLPDIGAAIGLSDIVNPFSFVITVLVGLNFVFELVLNIVLAPAVIKLTDLGKKYLNKK